MASPSLKPTSSPPPMDLKHTSSNSALTSKDHRLTNRTSQYARGNDQRLGSPTSIPSSPASIRSSSSAIFERDIEPIISPSPPSAHHQQTNPHRIPRAKGTGQLEQSVPSVLDSAAAILTGMGTEDVANEVAVVSPATSVFDVVERSSGFASPIGSFRSRSPSPVGSKMGQAASSRGEVQTPASILGLQNVGSPFSSPPSTLSPSPKVPRPTVHTAPLIVSGKSVAPDATPSLAVATQTPANDSTTSSQEPSPKTTTLEHFPPNIASPATLSPSSYLTNNGAPSSGFSMASPTNLSSHPPSPVHLPRKRLSFMSYSDLLTSTPTTTQPLSSLTTCATVAEPPPHIPGVSGLNIASAVYASGSIHAGSRAPSLRCLPLGAVGIGPTGGLTHPGKRDSIALLDNMGGEWEREGLGKGLDERLDALILSDSPPMSLGSKA